MNYDETLEISFHFFGQNMFGVSKARLRYEKAILYLEFFLLTSYAKKKNWLCDFFIINSRFLLKMKHDPEKKIPETILGGWPYVS